MDWTSKFAGRTEWMKRSAIRELLKVVGRPGMVSFAGGLPAPELFPVAQIEAAIARVLKQNAHKALQYGETEGVPALRDWLAEQFSTPRAKLKRENVLITTGAQQGLDLLGRVLFETGDKVVVENPTYLAALSAWRPWGVEFIAAATDVDGLQVDAVAKALEEKPKLLYTIPNFQNPMGITLAAERRPEIVRLAREADVVIAEDNPYGDLWYDGPPPASLFTFDSNVIYFGTFSKILAPSLRVGWTIAPEAVIDKMALAKQTADLQSSTFNQYIALEMALCGIDIKPLRAAYRERRDAMLEALDDEFPKSARWTKPAGGMFVWVTLPERLSAMELLPRAVEMKVAFVPGEDFHAHGGGRNTMRLNFSNATPADIRSGVARLGSVIRSAL